MLLTDIWARRANDTFDEFRLELTWTIAHRRANLLKAKDALNARNAYRAYLEAANVYLQLTGYPSIWEPINLIDTRQRMCANDA